MKIGFDFDKVFVDYPPFVPETLINYCYRYGMRLVKQSKGLSYRVPGSFEKQFRLLTHADILRPPIKRNISALGKIVKNKKHKTYLVSSRYDFLEKKSNHLLKKYKLLPLFDKVFFNFDCQQPHKFKEQILRREKINIYIDDDIELLNYLAKKLPKISFFWITDNIEKNTSSHITPIQNLNIFYRNYLKNK